MTWKEGDIARPPGRSYMIAEVLGPAGTVHITAPYEGSPGGRFWALWSYPTSSGINQPVFHGRPDGFDNVDVVMRQHQHTIQSMMGTAITIPASEGHPEETLEVPGELDRVREYNFLLNRAARTLANASGLAAINSAKDDMDLVLKRGL